LKNPYINSHLITCFIGVIVIITCTLYAQDVPVKQNNSIHKYIDRHITLGNLSQKNASVRPYTFTFVRSSLEKLKEIEGRLSITDKKLLQRYLIEFSVENFDDDVEFPLTKPKRKQLKGILIGDYETQNIEPHFLSYRDQLLFAWIDLNEKIGLETVDNSIYRRLTDKLSIYGSISNELSFLVDFTMNRFVGDSSLVYQLDGYKNEDNPYFDFANWTVWYQSNASFAVSTKYGMFSLAKTPVIWGFSPNYSPIFSGATQTFPFINYSFKNKFIGFTFLHGSLLPYRSTKVHKVLDYPQKYVAGHRIEFFLSNRFSFSFNELVIYGGRPFEVEYLIPVNFFWPAEHNLGDKDNLVMALDCSWQVKSGLRFYNTLFWDELAWEKVLSKWWGNKFVFQSGIHWVSETSPYLLEARIEGTVARPWTYSHEESISSYSSAGIGLGLPQGPSSQSIFVQAGIWPSYRWNLMIESMFLRKGTGLGNSVLDNYNDRDKDLDNNTPFILGDIQDTATFRLNSSFALNRILQIQGWLSYEAINSDFGGYLGIEIDW